MPVKRAFTDFQKMQIRQLANSVFERSYRSKGKTQKDMAGDLAVSQQTVSTLLRGTYEPGVGVAKRLAKLDGRTLAEVFDSVGTGANQMMFPEAVAPDGTFPYANLLTCIAFWEGRKTWSQWTLAAARAGFFGNEDLHPSEWEKVLDRIEEALAAVRYDYLRPQGEPGEDHKT